MSEEPEVAEYVSTQEDLRENVERLSQQILNITEQMSWAKESKDMRVFGNSIEFRDKNGMSFSVPCGFGFPQQIRDLVIEEMKKEAQLLITGLNAVTEELSRRL